MLSCAGFEPPCAQPSPTRPLQQPRRQPLGDAGAARACSGDGWFICASSLSHSPGSAGRTARGGPQSGLGTSPPPRYARPPASRILSLLQHTLSQHSVALNRCRPAVGIHFCRRQPCKDGRSVSGGGWGETGRDGTGSASPSPHSFSCPVPLPSSSPAFWTFVLASLGTACGDGHVLLLVVGLQCRAWLASVSGLESWAREALRSAWTPGDV